MAIKRRRNPATAVEMHPLSSIEFLTVDLSWDEETGNWATEVLELNRISDFGRTQEEALDRTASMIVSYIDVMQRRGVKPPFSAAQLKQIRERLA